MNVRMIVGILVLSGFVALTAEASPPRAVGDSLIKNPVDSVVRRVEQIPASLKTALARTFAQQVLYLGNPDQPLGEELSVPDRKESADRRLLFAFRSSGYYVVYVEYSPPAVHGAVMIYDTRTKRLPQFVWGAVDLNETYARSPRELIRRIMDRKLIEPPKVIW